jgi:hypothetical protein
MPKWEETHQGTYVRKRPGKRGKHQVSGLGKKQPMKKYLTAESVTETHRIKSPRFDRTPALARGLSPQLALRVVPRIRARPVTHV